MNLIVNGEEKEVRDGISLEELVTDIRGKKNVDGVAVAVEDQVIPRKEWKETKINEGQRIELIQAVQGG